MLAPLIVILSKDFSETKILCPLQLFRKANSHHTGPAWRYGVKGVIWRVYPTAGGALIGEERRIEEKKALFFGLDRDDGRELWLHPSPGDQWWIGIEAVDRDTVLLHGFANPNLPLHRGIIALDTRTGRKLWEDQDLVFMGIAGDSLVGSRETAAGQSFVELDRRSGAKRGDLTPSAVRALSFDRAGVEPEMNTPVPLEQLAADDPQLEAVITGHYDAGKLAGPVEVVEQKGLVIFDFQEATGRRAEQEPHFSSVVKVVERATGTVVYSDTVSTGALFAIPGLFFVQDDMLYYIKERRTLMAIRLAE